MTRTRRLYQITSRQGADYGERMGESPAAALVAQHHDAGYRDVRLAADGESIEWPDSETSTLCGDVDDWDITEARTRRTRPPGYTVCGEWGGYTIRRARTGWVVSQWSAIQGSDTGGRYLLRYDTPALNVARDADLASVVDVYDVQTTKPTGLRLYEVVCEQGVYSRILRHPVRVQ